MRVRFSCIRLLGDTMRMAALVCCGGALLLAGCKTVPPGALTQTSGRAEEIPGGTDPYGTYTNSVSAGTRRTRHGRGRRGSAEEQATPGQFDYYLLNLSWSPEYCASHAGSPECGQGKGFVVHGLWPQDFNGNYPEDCSDAPGPTNPGADLDIYPTRSLIAHEWQTHGTCSGLGADAYFAAVHTAFSEIKVPALPTGSAPPARLLSAFQAANPGFPAGSFALSCGNNRLTAVEACLDKNLKPEACQNVKTCGATSVGITAP